MGMRHSRTKSIENEKNLVESTVEVASPTPNRKKNVMSSILAIRRLSTASNTHVFTKPVISDRDKKILLESFGTLRESITKLGILTFLCLFETHPEMIQFFGNLRDLPPDMIKESKELRQHALRVMGFIEKCIARISSPEKLDAIIRQLGRHHVRYGAPPAFLQLVGPQFINAIRLHLETRWSPETEDAWLNLFSYIAYGMKQAMLTATDVQTPTPDLL
ncbi:hypothetical protein RvY_05727-2 [Ramazzottius varieornatus]|uniref:Globin domain-containing protein n=1 Tax=Ramazzottius varieornatus TaxID=947166 RepID=A0A1D1V5S9_RAMVA|nr:hypothetical protein RvY_05727-2 [Ramazzottius varieornatus]